VNMLDPELMARLVKQIVPCPVCGGSREVPKMVRIAREIPCPKDAALKMLLDENEEVGRLVIFAGFTGSVDRIVKLCLKEKWDVVRCAQGNFQVLAAKSDSAGQSRGGRQVAHPRGGPHGGVLVQLVETRVPRAERGPHPP